MLSKGLKTQRSEETPLAFSAAFTSKCVIQKGGWGSDNVSLFRTFIKAAARLTDAWGRMLLKWCARSPLLEALLPIWPCRPSLRGPAGNPVVSSGLQEGGACVQPRLCP